MTVTTHNIGPQNNVGKSCSLHANPLARSPGQVKLDSDKWK